MAAFPTVKYDWRDLSETQMPVVERAEMERGVPKQRRINSDARVEMGMTVHFDTAAEDASFMTWFNTTVHAGQDFFDFVHPVSGATVSARIVGGEMGGRRFKEPTRQVCSRSFKLEYWVGTY